MLQIASYYRLLKLDQDCSDQQLRRRYRKCALQTHPDKNNFTIDQSQGKKNQFIKFNEAYRRIVAHRKRINRDVQSRAQATQRKQKKPQYDWFESIKMQLEELNTQIFGSHQNKTGPFKINCIYDEHMKVLDSLSEQLRTMGQN